VTRNARIHEEVQQALARLARDAEGRPALLDLEPLEYRRQLEPLALLYAQELVDGVTREPIREGIRHRPETRQPGPRIVYVHGGGWVFLGPETHARFCDLLALKTGREVLSLRYLLAPENPFPAAPDHLQRTIAALAKDESVILAGDSAGANLALSCALALPERAVCGLGLIYGAFDDDFETESHRTYGGGTHPLTTQEMQYFWNSYAPGERPWRARPLHGPLSHAPPTVLLIAETDCLRSESEALERKLLSARRHVESRMMEGLYHGAILHDLLLPSLMPHVDWFADRLAAFEQT